MLEWSEKGVKEVGKRTEKRRKKDGKKTGNMGKFWRPFRSFFFFFSGCFPAFMAATDALFNSFKSPKIPPPLPA